ncbi:hypothetical protein Tco_0756784 [Tanacetum coccineum]
MLPSTGRVSSTNDSGSKPKSDTKNDRIPQASSKSMKNKVESHHRNNHVLDYNVNVKNVTEAEYAFGRKQNSRSLIFGRYPVCRYRYNATNLDRTDFESWQQRIRLYCLGKDNGENIMKSITEGPFQIGTFIQTHAEETEGALQLGPERARVFIDLSAEEKERFTKLINDMRNIKMTMPRMQLNSKFVNNMLPEWSRFITEVKLNRAVSQHKSSMSPQSSNEPSPADNFQLDSGSSSTDNLIESLTNTLVLLTQSYKSHLPQTNNQLRTSSNARNKATVQDGRVMVQDVRGRYNANNQGRPFHRNNARGNIVAGNAGGQNRGGNVNPGQAKSIKCYNCNGLGHIV